MAKITHGGFLKWLVPNAMGFDENIIIFLKFGVTHHFSTQKMKTVSAIFCSCAHTPFPVQEMYISKLSYKSSEMVSPCSSLHLAWFPKLETIPEPFPKINTLRGT